MVPAPVARSRREEEEEERMDDAYREAASACDVVIFSCSLSPVVVLVSHLFCGRRFERSEGAAHGATDNARATRAARAYTTGGSRRRSRAGAFARCVGLLLFLFSSCLSLRACHSTLAPPAPAGGALTTSARAAHAAHGATRVAHGESERRALSEHAVRIRGFAANGRPPGLCSARSCYLFKRKGKCV